MASANSRDNVNGFGPSSQTFPLRDLHHNPVPTPPSGTPAFDSYAAYLKSILDYGPEYNSLIEYLESDESAADSPSSIMVAEVHNDKISCKNFGLPYSTNAALASILSTSEQGSMTLQAQIILVQSYLGQGIRKLVDAIGLLYDVDPAFFQMVPLSSKRDFTNSARPRSFPPVFSMPTLFSKSLFEAIKRVPRPPPPRRFLSINRRLVCQMLQGRNVAGNEYSVVLGFINSKTSIGRGYWYVPPMDSRPNTHYPPRFSRGAKKNIQSYDMVPSVLTNHFKTWDANHIAAANNNSYLYIYPLLHMTAQDLSVGINGIRTHYNTAISRRWVQTANDRREMVEELMYEAAALSSALDHVTDFVQDLEGLPNIHPEAQEARYHEVLAYWREVLNDGRRVTRMVQSHTQSEIGLWTIQASQRSIEEAVSVKRLTQLAFIFIPLSFVTSLYGMNVKEISGDGVRLWVFFVTAICIMFLILFMWLFARSLELLWKFINQAFQRPRRSGRETFYVY